MTSKTVQFPTANSVNKRASMLNEFKSEIRKISWPSKAEVAKGTKSVLISLFVFGLGIYAVDLGIRGFLNLFQSLINALFR
jgi:preprotein translocase subunit SecE